MKYSIDTSSILDGWRRYYPPDVFPALWDRIDELIASGALRATEEVLTELERKDDEVHEWARQRTDLFVPIEEPRIPACPTTRKEPRSCVAPLAGESDPHPWASAGLARSNSYPLLLAVVGGLS